MITICGDLTFRHKQAAQRVFFDIRNFREGFMRAASRHGRHSCPRRGSVSAENAGWFSPGLFANRNRVSDKRASPPPALRRTAAKARETMKVQAWRSGQLASLPLSSSTKCNIPCRSDIGLAVQDQRECCYGIHSHLSEEERDQIGVLRATGRSIGAIAKALGRPKRTISRELARNSWAQLATDDGDRLCATPRRW
jgi:hypothetical protein